MKQWLINKFIYMFINQHKIDIVSIPSLFSLIITNICIFFCRWSFYVKQSEESESKLIKKIIKSVILIQSHKDMQTMAQ